jgi:hypothetical protein
MVLAANQIPATNNILPGTNFRLSGNCLQIQLNTPQATLAAGDLLYLQQAVEGQRFRELSFDVSSISLVVYSSVAPLTFGVSLRDPGSAHSIVFPVTISAAQTFTLLTIPNIPVWPTAGNFVYTPSNLGYVLGICLASGTTYTTPANGSWQNGNFLGAVGQSNFASFAANSSIFLGFVQHEPGPICTTPIDLPFEDNLDACLRYYGKSYSYQTLPGAVTNPGATYLNYAGNLQSTTAIMFKKTMARAPTIGCFNPATGAAGTVRNLATNTDLTVSAVVNPGDTGFAGFAVSAPPATTWYASYHWTADTGW